MVRYSVNTEDKVIELLSSGSLEELKDLYELYKDYKFTIKPQIMEGSQGIVVGGGYIPVISRIERG